MSIPGVKQLQDVAARAVNAGKVIGTTPGAEIALPPQAALKLAVLRRDGRDFEGTTPLLDKEVAAAFISNLLVLLNGKGSPNPWEAAAQALKDRLKRRLANGGDDARGQLRPLRPATIAAKGHRRIGYRTGRLLADVNTANIRRTR